MKKITFIILVLIACILWGSAFAGAKIGFQYVGPIHLSGLRFTLAGLLLVPVLLFNGTSWRESFKHWRFMLLFGFIQTYLQYGLFFMGLNDTPGAVAAVISGSGPLFVAVMAHFTISNDRFTLRKILSISMGMLGVIFISVSKGVFESMGSVFYLGITYLLLSNIVGSSTNIIVAKSKRNLSPIMLTSFANFSGGIMLYITAYFVEGIDYSASYPLEFYIALVWLAIIPAAAFSIWYYLLKQKDVKVSELNIWKFIVPVVGAIFSWLLLPGEYPDWKTIVGIITISLSIIILQAPGRPSGGWFKRVK